MKVIIEQEVTKCRDCFYATNSSQLHDCAFTSAPHPTIWYCRKMTNNCNILHNENIIDPKCPLIPAFEKWWNSSIYSLAGKAEKQFAFDVWNAAKAHKGD